MFISWQTLKRTSTAADWTLTLLFPLIFYCLVVALHLALLFPSLFVFSKVIILSDRINHEKIIPEITH